MYALLTKYRDWIVCVGIGGIIVGGIGIFFLPGMWWRATAFQKMPQQVTLSELAKNGPGDNPYVIVSDFVCGSHFAFQIETRGGSSEPAQEQSGSGQAWIPLFSKSELQAASTPDEPAPEPTSFVVVLETSKANGDATQFHLLSRRATMQGLIVPSWLSDLTPDLRGKLLASYPDTKLDRCLILEEVRRGDKDEALLLSKALLLGAILGPLFGVPTLVLAIVLGRKKTATNVMAEPTAVSQPG